VLVSVFPNAGNYGIPVSEFAFGPAGRATAVVYEELYDEAIERAETSGGPSVIESVVEAVSDQRPDWAIKACETQAEPIIENGQHDRYRTAVRWLERAGTIAQEADSLEEWRDYQKYKLRPMLDELLEEF